MFGRALRNPKIEISNFSRILNLRNLVLRDSKRAILSKFKFRNSHYAAALIRYDNGGSSCIWRSLQTTSVSGTMQWNAVPAKVIVPLYVFKFKFKILLY